MLPFVILGVVNAYIFLNTGKKVETDKGTGTWTVYGTTWCDWITQQLEYSKSKGIDHTFVDCEKRKCDGIYAFSLIDSLTGQ